MDNDIKISIILPVFNDEKYIINCLNSLIYQTLKEIEIICVEDCSNNDLSEVLEYFRLKDSRIKVIKNKQATGQGALSNIGLKYASGKYIQFIDSCDWIDSHTLEELYNKIDIFGADLILYNIICYDNKSKKFFKTNDYSMDFMNKYLDKVFSPKDLEKNLIFRLCETPCNKLFKTSLLKENNIFFNDLFLYEDNLFHFEIMFSSKKILFVNNHYYNRRINVRLDSNIISMKLIDVIEKSDAVLSFFLRKKLYSYLKIEIINYILFGLWNNFYKISKKYKDDYYEKMHIKLRKYYDNYSLKDDFEYYMNKNYNNFYHHVYDLSTLKEYNKKIIENKSLKKEYSLSIIIPHYNSYIKDIKRAIDSIKNQTFGFENLEVIIVDDASIFTQSWVYLRQIYDEYENIQLLFLDVNGGVGNARNKGIEHARGKYIMFLDHDDYYMKNACEILYDCITNNDLELVCGNYINLSRDGKKSDWSKIFNSNFTIINSVSENMECLKIDPSIWAKIYKKKFLFKNNIKFKNCCCGEDLLFIQESLFNAKGIGFIDEPIVVYEMRSIYEKDFLKSISLNNSIKVLKSLINIYCESYELFKEYYKDYVHISLNALNYFIDSRLMFSNLKYDEFKSLFENTSYLFQKHQLNSSVYKSLHEDLIKKIASEDWEKAYKIYVLEKNT